MSPREKFYLTLILIISSVSLFKFHEVAGWYGVFLSAFVYSNVAMVAFIVGLSAGKTEMVKENADSVRRKGKQKVR